MSERPLHLPGEEWREDARCLGVDPSLFYPQRGDNAAVNAAKAVCAACTVREECLDFALTENMTQGIWGGTTGRQRRSMRRDLRLIEGGEA